MDYPWFNLTRFFAFDDCHNHYCGEPYVCRSWVSLLNIPIVRRLGISDLRNFPYIQNIHSIFNLKFDIFPRQNYFFLRHRSTPNKPRSPRLSTQCPTGERLWAEKDNLGYPFKYNGWKYREEILSMDRNIFLAALPVICTRERERERERTFSYERTVKKRKIVIHSSYVIRGEFRCYSSFSRPIPFLLPLPIRYTLSS